jgi:hypothetical protein
MIPKAKHRSPLYQQQEHLLHENHTKFRIQTILTPLLAPLKLLMITVPTSSVTSPNTVDDASHISSLTGITLMALTPTDPTESQTTY